MTFQVRRVMYPPRRGRPLGPAVGGGALGLASFPRSDVRVVIRNNGIIVTQADWILLRPRAVRTGGSYRVP
jgi:hypothetical protein